MSLPSSLHRLGTASWSTRWRRLLSQWLDRQAMSESAIIMLTALVVGAGAGLGAVVFRRLIAGAQTLAYGGLGGWWAWQHAVAA